MFITRRRFIGAVAGVALLAGLACSPAGSALPPPATPTVAAPADRAVAASFPILADIVANVAGDRLRVISVIPPGSDPHTWEPVPQDLIRVGRTRGFMAIGASHERFLETGGVQQVVRDRAMPSLIYANHIPLIAVDKVVDHGDHVHDLREGDPHVWLDPLKVVEMLPVTVEFLSGIDPDGRAVFEANAARYREEVLALHAELEAAYAGIPRERRNLVVFHDAYTYFGARYDFRVLEHVIKGPGREPTAQELAALRTVILDSRVPAVFKEPQFNARVLEQVASDLKIPVGTLMTDSFTPQVQTYLGLMRFNKDSLVKYLGS
jgi:ABC-type Zn uptake system ZnuABC Zn-binding protein ZnuA